jgi:hypothetical protein
MGEPFRVLRPITKSLMANSRLCRFMGSKYLSGEATEKTWEPPTGAALLGIALHKALATIYGVWMRGDHVNTDYAALTQIWNRAWISTGTAIPPDPEGPDRLRVYVGLHEYRFVGPRRTQRVVYVERRLRAQFEEFTVEATPDAIAVSVDSRTGISSDATSHVLAIEHTSAATNLASVEQTELAALLVQYVLKFSPALPKSIREMPRAVVLDDLNTGEMIPITVLGSRASVLLQEVAADLRGLLAASDPITLATPSESACSRCAWRSSCSVAWRKPSTEEVAA